MTISVLNGVLKEKQLFLDFQKGSHSAKGTNTIVIINSGIADKAVTLTGSDLPATYKMYRTNATTDNCTFIKEIGSGTNASFAVPVKSIVTLQAGGDAL